MPINAESIPEFFSFGQTFPDKYINSQPWEDYPMKIPMEGNILVGGGIFSSIFKFGKKLLKPLAKKGFSFLKKEVAPQIVGEIGKKIVPKVTDIIGRTPGVGKYLQPLAEEGFKQAEKEAIKKLTASGYAIPKRVSRGRGKKTQMRRLNYIR